MTATATINRPFYVGDYGHTIQLTVYNEEGQTVTFTGTVDFIFGGCCTGTKSATPGGSGVATWVTTAGFFTTPGTGKVRAQVTQSGSSSVIKSNWINFPVAE